MRLASLAIEHFRAIRRLDIAFGRGLNVLHGPNDLGKSTLATAIRAALLVPPSSSEAESYQSWYSGNSPRVELALVDDDERWWKVVKNFGSAGASAAELFHSKDGKNWTLDCHARQVEETLRSKVLQWGIPAPGGRGGTRGMPDAFLVNVLLGRQDGVDQILERSLAEDPAESGKLRLGKALAALAQDPLFKEVLAHAQREFDQRFTETGRARRGQASPFTQATARVRDIQEALTECRRKLDESQLIEAEVVTLRAQVDKAQRDVDESDAHLVEQRERFQRGVERSRLEAQLKAANDALAAIDAEASRLAQMTQELEVARRQATSAEEALHEATRATTSKSEAHRAADDALRIAASQDAQREQAMRRAQIEKGRAELVAKGATLAALQNDIRTAIDARRVAREARQAETTTAANLEKAKAGHAQALVEEQQLANEVEVARALTAFVRWRAAVAAEQDASKVRVAVKGEQELAATKEAEAAKLAGELAAATAVLEQRAQQLPSSAAIQALVALERELERAEAALGGGLSFELVPRRPLDISVRVDDLPESGARAASATVAFEAERRLRLSIDGVAEMDVCVGSPDARRVAESLRERWRTEAAPLLERSRLDRLDKIAEAAQALERERAQLGERQRSVDQLRTDGRNLREQAAIREQSITSAAADADEMEARRAALGEHRPEELEAHWQAMKRPAERALFEVQETLQKRHGVQVAKVAQWGETEKQEGQRLQESRTRAKDAEALLASRMEKLPAADLDGQHKKAEDEAAALKQSDAALEEQLRAVATDADEALKKAKAALEAATSDLNRARTAEAAARSALSDAARRRDLLQGQAEQLMQQVARLDRDRALATVRECEAALAAIPPESVASQELLDAAEGRAASAAQAHGEVRGRLLTREGALLHVGGAVLKEELQRLEEARAVAESQERALEVDAEAWRLLRETLREVENAEGAHLGRALAQPVTSRFEELTAGRYGGLRLDPLLRAEGLEAKGSSAQSRDVLDSLSVGTRNQLATLVRVTIADQLKTAIVLDDHLVNADLSRLAWFHDLLGRIAVNAQVVIITCRPRDYLDDLGVAPIASTTEAPGRIRTIDLGQELHRHEARST